VSSIRVGRRKRQQVRVGRPHVATWAETETVLAADLGDGTDDPRATRRTCCAAPWPPCRNEHGNRGG